MIYFKLSSKHVFDALKEGHSANYGWGALCLSVTISAKMSSIISQSNIPILKKLAELEEIIKKFDSPSPFNLQPDQEEIKNLITRARSSKVAKKAISEGIERATTPLSAARKTIIETKKAEDEDEGYGDEEWEDDYESDFVPELTKPPSPSKPKEEPESKFSIESVDFQSIFDNFNQKNINQASSIFKYLHDSVQASKLFVQSVGRSSSETAPISIKLHDKFKSSNSVKTYSSLSTVHSSIAEKSRGSLVHEATGLGVLIDPAFSSSGHPITLRFTYHSDTHEIVEEIVNIQSSGLPYHFHLTTSAQTTSSYASIALPGWDGIPPVFLPSLECSLEIYNTFEDQDDVIFPSLSFLVIPVSSLSSMLHQLEAQCENFCLRSRAKLRILGGLPVLNLAVFQGAVKVVTSLVQHGNDPNTRAAVSLETSLHDAIYANNIKILGILLRASGNQLLADNRGNLPMHLACRFGRVDLIRMLADHPGGGEALSAVNKKDKRPVDLCPSEYVRKVVEALMAVKTVAKKVRIPLSKR